MDVFQERRLLQILFHAQGGAAEGTVSTARLYCLTGHDLRPLRDRAY